MLYSLYEIVYVSSKLFSPSVHCVSGHPIVIFVGEWLCPYLVDNGYVFVRPLLSSTCHITSPLVPAHTLITSLIMLLVVLEEMMLL